MALLAQVAADAQKMVEDYARQNRDHLATIADLEDELSCRTQLMEKQKLELSKQSSYCASLEEELIKSRAREKRLRHERDDLAQRLDRKTNEMKQNGSSMLTSDSQAQQERRIAELEQQLETANKLNASV